jgi:ubiquinone/menaquinone biosynthesis C-methylase UbiE
MTHLCDERRLTATDRSEGTKMESTATHYDAHYTSGDLRPRITAMLDGAGTSPSTATPEQMAAFDQFHVRGVLATRELADLAGFANGQHVLDVGCGIGGPARYLNTDRGCHVTGIDLTDEFVQTANWLTEEQRQGGSVKFVTGSALDTPFEDASFDGAWMQHVNMNIADKAGLFREIARVLKPGAKFAMHEVLADKADQPHFPVPWSRNPEGSHLVDEPKFRAALESAGFQILEWKDETRVSVEWMSAMFAKMQESGPPPINVGVLLGPEFPAMARNANQSMEEGLIKVVMVVVKKKE